MVDQYSLACSRTVTPSKATLTPSRKAKLRAASGSPKQKLNSTSATERRSQSVLIPQVTLTRSVSPIHSSPKPPVGPNKIKAGGNRLSPTVPRSRSTNPNQRSPRESCDSSDSCGNPADELKRTISDNSERSASELKRTVSDNNERSVRVAKNGNRDREARSASRRLSNTVANEQSSGGERFKVFCRIRPVRPEVDGEGEMCVNRITQNVLTVPAWNGQDREMWIGKSLTKSLNLKSDEKPYKFEQVLGMDATQAQMYDVMGRPLLENTLNGYNTCMFAYGQTGSGKTYSLQGLLDDPDRQGIVPRICADLFDQFAERRKCTPDLNTTITLSFFEIYNEEIYDLLDPKQTFRALDLRENASGSSIIVGLSKHAIDTNDQVKKLLQTGQEKRHAGDTFMNRLSSRSHCILQLNIRQTFSSPDAAASDLESIMTIVDLAGSERPSKTEFCNLRKQESMEINKSLLILGRALKALADKQPHVPMRESKLTRLLGEYFTGNAKTVMLATVAPMPAHLPESLSTLEFAQHVSAIRSCARINRVERSTNVPMLQQKVEALQRELDRQKKEYEKQLRMKDCVIADIISADRNSSPSIGHSSDRTSDPESAGREMEREKEREKEIEMERERARALEAELEREKARDKAREEELSLEREKARALELELSRQREKEKEKKMEEMEKKKEEELRRLKELEEARKELEEKARELAEERALVEGEKKLAEQRRRQFEEEAGKERERLAQLRTSATTQFQPDSDKGPTMWGGRSTAPPPSISQQWQGNRSPTHQVKQVYGRVSPRQSSRPGQLGPSKSREVEADMIMRGIPALEGEPFVE